MSEFIIMNMNICIKACSSLFYDTIDQERHVVDNDETTLSFAVFASRDLKADEEAILGWE
jgi:hypothetical protein